MTNIKHKYRYQQAVRYKDKLAYIESLILADKYHYQVRLHDTMDIYNCEERELEQVDEGDSLLYGK